MKKSNKSWKSNCSSTAVTYDEARTKQGPRPRSSSSTAAARWLLAPRALRAGKNDRPVRVYKPRSDCVADTERLSLVGSAIVGDTGMA